MHTLEHLIETFEISLYPHFWRDEYDNLGQPHSKRVERFWKVQSKTPRKEDAEGPTVREAIENLVQKLTQ